MPKPVIKFDVPLQLAFMQEPEDGLPELGDHLLGTVPLPVRRTLHRRLLSAPWAVKVSHSGWTCSAHPCQPGWRPGACSPQASPGRPALKASKTMADDNRHTLPSMANPIPTSTPAPPRTQGPTAMHQLS
jgi:hypothetical protein